MADSNERTSNSDTVHSTVVTYPSITKVDKPELEDPVIENDEKDTPVFKICSPTVRSNVLTQKNPFKTTLKSSILKAPQLNLTTSSSGGSSTAKSCILSPPKLNPFAKSVTEDDKKDETTNGAPLKFVPLVSEKNDVEKNKETTSTKNTTTSTVSSTSFVFGQNLQDRVVSIESKSDESKPSTSLSTNGSTDMLFSNAIKNDIKTSTNNTSSSNNKESKSLSESAREYEQSRAIKRKYDEVEVKTGEEEELNILCVSCKLFSFEGTSRSWHERGRGTLRLNDFEADGRTQSRLVFRTSGSFRVILNTKVFAKMSAEKASDKSIRLTAIDANGEIKVFLVTASVEDSKSLHQALEHRIKLEIEASKQESRNRGKMNEQKFIRRL